MPTKNENPYLIHHDYGKKVHKILAGRGVSMADILHKGKSFDLEDSLVKIECDGEKLKRISVEKQVSFYDRILATKILSGKWLQACISSYPSDLRAKQVAIHLFQHALIAHTEMQNSRRKFNRTLPIWHRIYGGFGDSLRDAKGEPPSFIVLSNITANCTNLKHEKVRDICEKYNALNIPVVVVCGGCDPLTLFSYKLHYPLRYAFYLGSDKAAKSMME